MEEGFDCATKLSLQAATALREAGFVYVARYLGESWKTFDQKEAAAIQAAGLQLISIFQKSANHSAYFNEKQGKLDGKEAQKYAEGVGQPKGTAIYFAIDFDVQPKDKKKILSYIDGVKSGLKDYQLGIYGSCYVMEALKGQVDYYWQTYAWSRGEICDFIHMYQYENNVRVAGVLIDRNEIKKAPGDWGDFFAASESSQTYVVKAAKKAYLTAKDALVNQHPKGTVRPGSYYIFNESLGMINVSKQKNQPGSWIHPAENNANDTNESYHLVQKKETLTSIAKKYQTTVAKLQALNHLDNPNLIYVNQKIRYK